MTKCPRCKGSGEIDPYKSSTQFADGKPVMLSTCPTCRGAKEVHERSALKWHIRQAEIAGDEKRVKQLHEQIRDIDAKRATPEAAKEVASDG